MDFLTKILNPILGFVLTLIFGFWLSRRGKPYNGLLFNVHKLVALGAVILAALVVYRELKTFDPATMMILSLLVAVIGIIALFVSGALMSAGKGEYRVMKLIHNISPFILVLAMAVAVYLFAGWS